MADKRPPDVGWYGRFALGALAVAVVGLLAQSPVISGIGLLLAVLWGVQAWVRLVRIHRYVQRTHPADAE